MSANAIRTTAAPKSHWYARLTSGKAHSWPGSQSLVGLQMRRQASASEMTAALRKTGCRGPSSLKWPIQAPEMPREINIRGPRQQAEASRAANPPVNRSEEHTSELQSQSNL